MQTRGLGSSACSQRPCYLAASVEPDEGAAADAIKRRLGRETGATTDGLKFAELHRRLSQQPGLRNRWALLHVLQQAGAYTRPLLSST
jgi:hypothetical protein